MEQDIRYPIGRVEFVEYSESVRLRCLSDIEQLPSLLEAAVQHLDEVQLHTPIAKGVGRLTKSCITWPILT